MTDVFRKHLDALAGPGGCCCKICNSCGSHKYGNRKTRKANHTRKARARLKAQDIKTAYDTA